MILGCEKDKNLIGKDETMKDYLPEQIIDIIRSAGIDNFVTLEGDVDKRGIYRALARGNLDLDDMMDLCVASVNCMIEITHALKGAGYEL